MSREEPPLSASLPPRAAMAVGPESPWLGLSSFTEDTRAYFFGRSAELQDLDERIVHKPLTVLFGQSGLGKTSLLQAALVPRLREQGYLPVLLRLEHTPSAPPLERQVIRALYAAVRGRPAPDEGGPAECENLWLLFHDPVFGFTGADGEGPGGKPPVRPVFLFDQFEEIFTLGEHSKRREDALRFRDALACLIENRAPETVRRRVETDDDLADRLDYAARPAKVLLTLREDFLHVLERWRRQMPSLMDNRVELRLLTGPQALQAVVEPGKLRGPGRPPIISEEMGAAIVRFVAGTAADVPLEEIDAVPPLLSLICSELNARRFDALRRMREDTIQPNQLQGRSEDILQGFYHLSFVGVPNAVRCLVEDRLLSADGFRESLSLNTAYRVLEDAGISTAAAGEAIAHLVNCRLLVAEERGGVRRVELTHDVLTGVARLSREQRWEIAAAERAKLQAKDADNQAREQYWLDWRQLEAVKAQERDAVLHRRRLAVLTILLLIIVLLAVRLYLDRSEVAEAQAQLLASRRDPPSERTEPVRTSNLDENMPSAKAADVDLSRTNSPVDRPDLFGAQARWEVDGTNIQARKDLLKRVQQMPHLSDEQKAKLTDLVGRARNMGCIFIIPFQASQREIGQRETDLLVSGFESPAIQQLLKDPTVVFVVLGYADKQGDPASNEKVSNERTQSVLTAMKERCGVQNVSYGVSMGGSDMFDGKSAAKNRQVEIWAVFL